MDNNKQLKIIVSDDLKKKVQVKCIKENTTMVDVITKFLEKWVK